MIEQIHQARQRLAPYLRPTPLVYSEELNANSLERLTLESSLRHALERNEFRLHYQAKRDIASGKITGMRWCNGRTASFARGR